ncbi:MAG TPA: hypothetical protein VHS96_03830 [Bacteroidia bacterium]|nr:hypothetical protein [Bacteroidia bacterium]
MHTAIFLGFVCVVVGTTWAVARYLEAKATRRHDNKDLFQK